MPNWCSGSITSDSPELADRIRQIEADGGKDVMGRFYPMPEPLRGVHTGGRRIGDEYVTKWRGDGDDAVAVAEAESAALIEAYGADNWYDWNVANWGCKWDFDIHHAEYVGGGVRERFIQIPTVELKSIATTVTIPDGGTVLAGGLAKADETSGMATVPLVSGIPLLRYIFREWTDAERRTSMVILVTAHIVKDIFED